MCIEVKNEPVFEVAEEDLKVFKALNYDRTPPFRSKFVYKQDQLYGTAIETFADLGYVHISRAGLYSYKSYFWAFSTWCFHKYIYRATIPKGSTYFIGPCGEIISDKLIVGKRMITFSNILLYLLGVGKNKK